MDKIYEIKQYVVQFYAKYSRWVECGLRFVLALLTFSFISSHIGFLDSLANPVVTIALSVICAFLPVMMTTVLAAAVVLLQFFVLAPGIAIVSAVILFVMFAMYFRFTPGRAHVLLLTPIAFVAKIPVAIPIVFALLCGPSCAIPISFGIIVYYMLAYVKSYATIIGTVAEAGVVEQLTTFTQYVFSNKEMWIYVVSFVVCLIITYYIRRMAIDHAWEIAAIAGVLVHIILMAFSHVVLNTKVEYGVLVLGCLLTIVIALIIKIFFFSVDYSRAEHLQFEDEEYYYYVKAIPKVSVALQEKTVKKINTRQDMEEGKDDVKEEANDNAKEADEVKQQEAAQEAAKEELKKKLEQDESEIQKIIEQELKN